MKILAFCLSIVLTVNCSIFANNKNNIHKNLFKHTLVHMRLTECKQNELIKANNKYIQYTGRIDFTDPEKPRFWAPGVYIKAKFKGTSCEILFNDEMVYGTSLNYLEIIIDDTLQIRIQSKGKTNMVKVADSLPEGEHTIVICKDTESNVGYIEFIGFKCEELLPLPVKPKRKIEFIGNSITCGMGNDDSQIKCNSREWYDQHNAYMAYGPLLARRFNTQYHLSSISGIGLMHSCCEKTITMPGVFHKLDLENDSINWDFKRYIPDLVTICLGQNDGIQDSVIFCNTYISFIHKIRSYYPNAKILCLSSPMGDKNLTTVLSSYLNAIVDYIIIEGDKKVEYFIFKNQYIGGCDSHPTIKEHKLIAEELEPLIKKTMGW